MIIDSHQHFIDVSRFRYGWMSEDSPLRRDFLPEHLEPELRRAGVDRTIVVEAHNSIEEARWLLGLAGGQERIAGVVAQVDLTSPRLPWLLDELMRGRLVGVRHQVEAEPDPFWLTRRAVLDGLREVARRGLPFDLVVFPRHYPAVRDLAARLPQLRLVLDHLGKPPIRSLHSRGSRPAGGRCGLYRCPPASAPRAPGGFMGWAAEFAALARIPGLHCKLSGLVTEADHARWTVDDLRPYVMAAWELFGPQRLMWGSDWPVCLKAATYQATLQSVLIASGPRDQADLDAVLGGNATRFYRLAGVAGSVASSSLRFAARA